MTGPRRGDILKRRMGFSESPARASGSGRASPRGSLRAAGILLAGLLLLGGAGHADAATPLADAATDARRAAAQSWAGRFCTTDCRPREVSSWSSAAFAVVIAAVVVGARRRPEPD